MDILRTFPNLVVEGYQATSERSLNYNCIAWAAAEQDRWWWPDRQGQYYWPAHAPREESLRAFLIAFGTLGYEPCDSDQLEDGFEKVAIFAGPDGRPTHAARQLSNGWWTSKLGRMEDIQHALAGLHGDSYGRVAQVLRRPV